MPENDSRASGVAEHGDASRIDRRAALKKAAAATAAAGAVWAAPSIEGLSIVPDYAAAGTVTGVSVVLRFGDTDGPTYPGIDNYFQIKPSPNTSGPNTPNQNQPIQITGNLGPAGFVLLTVPAGVLADGNPFNGTVRFDVDPPHNRCAIASITSNPAPGPGNNFGPAPIPNVVSPFTVPFNVGDHPFPTSRVDDVSITVTCT